MKELIKDLLPIMGVGLAAGVAIGVLAFIWAYTSTF